MTNNQKENLLKLLLNKPKDEPDENVPSYSDTFTYTDNLGDTYDEKMGYSYYGTPYRIIKRGDTSYAFNSEQITSIRYVGNNDLEYSVKTWLNEHLLDLIADENGIYGLRMNYVSGVHIWLDYYDDLLNIKTSYDISQMLKDVSGTTNLGDSIYNGTLRLCKSPIDGRFLIVTSLIGQTYFAVIEYTINVGSENTYKYQRIAKNTLTTNNPVIDDMYVSWSEDSVEYAIGIISHASVTQTKTNLYIYEIIGTMDTINSSTISYLQNVWSASLLARINQTPQIRYRTMTDRYYSYSTISNTLEDSWYSGNVVLSRLNGDTRTELSRIATQFMMDSSNNAYKNEGDIIILNDNVFYIETILTASNKLQSTFKQLIGDEMHGKIVISDKDYAQTDLAFTFISNEFNLYRYSYQLGNDLYTITSVFRPSGYNGVPYFSNKSLSPQSGQLYDITSEVVFARDLYNKTIIGDTINSIIHVPSNYLNEKPIMEEMLISYTNEAIDDVDEEIEKNEYEELYINFVDTYKVWDMNNKKAYQQRASYETATQLNEGFEMYVGTFRITYNDDTTKESSLGDIPIVDGEGVIEIYFEVKQVGAKTLEILDQNYDIVFATIDLSNLQPGAYKITEKVKVEG